MQQGNEPASLFSGTSHWQRRAVIPLLYNGSARIGLLVIGRGDPAPTHVRPFNSEVHSASALLPCFQTAVIPDRVLGSLEIALKRTRPRQRFWILLGEILCQRARCVKG